jgi:hypothetical protein
MGYVLIPPRPQADNEADADYDAYLHGDYREYLVEMRNLSRAQSASGTRWMLLLLVVVLVIAMLVAR